MEPYTTAQAILTIDQSETASQPNDLVTFLEGRRVYPEPSDDVSRIDVSKVLYFGIVQKNTSAIVHSPWAEATKGHLRRHRIFARTSDEVYIISKHKVLKRMLPLLDGDWEQAHQSLLINVRFVKTRNDRAKRVAFVDHINPTGDAVDVSKRCWRRIKQVLQREKATKNRE